MLRQVDELCKQSFICDICAPRLKLNILFGTCEQGNACIHHHAQASLTVIKQKKMQDTSEKLLKLSLDINQLAMHKENTVQFNI